MGIKGKFDDVEKNLKDALELNLNVIASVVVGNPYLESGEFDIIQKKWSKDIIFGHNPGNWAGKVYKLKYVPQHEYCRWHRHLIHVNLKGEMCLCCFDPRGRYGFGSLLENSLKDIWFGEKHQQFLRRLEEHGRASIIPCSECTTI